MVREIILQKFEFVSNDTKYKLLVEQNDTLISKETISHWPDSWKMIILKYINYSDFKYISLTNVYCIKNYYPIFDKEILWDMPYYHVDDKKISTDSHLIISFYEFHKSLTKDIKKQCNKFLLLSEFW